MHAYRTIGAAALIAGLCLAGGANAQVPESEDPIKLTLHDWTGQYITTEIMGRVLESMGYNVEYVQADYLAQFAGLEAGDLHVAMEMWETTGKDAMEASLPARRSTSARPACRRRRSGGIRPT
jgi:glycine betaine/proline transport system substrate-binding protein